MEPLAIPTLVINGNSDGTENADRMHRVHDLCQRLGLNCTRTPAQFVTGNAIERASACGVKPPNEHKAGLWLAHREAWKQVANAATPHLIMEDDVDMPSLKSDDETRERLFEYLHTSAERGEDLSFVSHLGTAYRLSPAGAKHLLSEVGECEISRFAVDHYMMNFVKDNSPVQDERKLHGSFAVDWSEPAFGDHQVCGHGIGCSGILPQTTTAYSYRLRA
jgi:hypothetical protein